MIISFFGLAAIHTQTADAATAPGKAPLISSLPLIVTTEPTAEFAFGPGSGESQPITGYECKLDDGAFAACTSPTTYTDLSAGDHIFIVRAINGVGSGPEATFTWTVETALPDVAAFETLTVSPTTSRVKPGGRTTISVSTVNVGDIASTSSSRVCVTGPARLVKVKRCLPIAGVEVDATGTVKFSVTVSKKAARGRKAFLKFELTSPGQEPIKARATVTVS